MDNFTRREQLDPFPSWLRNSPELYDSPTPSSNAQCPQFQAFDTNGDSFRHSSDFHKPTNRVEKGLSQNLQATKAELEDELSMLREGSTNALQSVEQHYILEMSAIRHDFSKDILATRHMLGSDISRQKWVLENNSILNGAEYDCLALIC